MFAAFFLYIISNWLFVLGLDGVDSHVTALAQFYVLMKMGSSV